jgi:membrane protease YdiL (CAAX protease family)
MINKQNTIRAVNFLYLAVLGLMVSNVFLTWLPQYVRLILVQVLMVFLPAYLFLRFIEKDRSQSIAERVRWRWPGWKIGVLALLVGAGLYPFSAVTASVLQQLLGYSEAALVVPDAIPTTVLMGVLAIVSYAFLAPLCEEFLFRGVIQPVYERRGKKWGVLFVSMLFVAFHLSLLQGLSIILLSLALGFINMRTRSLQASMLSHFGANFLASLVITDQVFHTGAQTWLFTAPMILGGVALSAASLVLLVNLTRHKSSDRQTVPEMDDARTVISPRRSWLAVYWPLVAALFIYLPFISAEVILSRSPELIERLSGISEQAEPLVLESSPWQGRQEWQYEIRNIADDVVGEGACRLIASEPTIEITCISAVEAYEVQQGSSQFLSSGGERTDHLAWNRSDGRMLEGSSIMDLSDGSFSSEISWSVSPGAVDIHRQDSILTENISMPLEGSTLLVVHSNSWPWQLAGTKLEAGHSGSIVDFEPFTWRSETQDQGPVTEIRRLTVVGQEQIETPAGIFTTWKVTSGRHEAAWIDASDGRTVVKFFNGIETWTIKTVDGEQ